MTIPGQPTDGINLAVLNETLVPYATISAVNAALNTKLNTSGGVVSGLLSFSGLDSVGIRLKSLTSVQYGNLTPGNGDLFLDSTANRVDVRLNGATEELLDTRGGQQVNGTITATGSIRASSFWAGAGNNTIVNGDGGAVILQTGGFGRWQISANNWIPVTTNALDLGSTTNRVRDLYTGGINATGNVTTTSGYIGAWADLNSISRRISTATLSLGIYAMPTAFHNVTIPGTLTNSSGVAGQLLINSTINQTGTAGSSDFVINRTETVLGSGNHRFIDLKNAGTSRWYVDREGSQFFCNGADSTRIARAPGASGRLLISRPNNPGAIAVQIGGGNDELFVGQSGEGSFRVSGSGVQLGSTGSFLFDSVSNSFTFRGVASTTMATLTGTGNLVTVGTITSPENIFTNGANSTRVARATGTTGRLQIYRPNDPVTPSVEFGGGNDEIRIRGGLGTLTHSGTQFQIGSTAAMTISATVGSLSLGSNGSTTLTMTGADSVFGGSISWSDVRIQRVAKTFRTECFESTLSAWQETSRQEASATGPRWSVMGATPIVRQTHAAVATDLATAITRLNTLCTHLTNFGLFN